MHSTTGVAPRLGNMQFSPPKGKLALVCLVVVKPKAGAIFGCLGFLKINDPMNADLGVNQSKEQQTHWFPADILWITALLSRSLMYKL